MSSSSTPQPPDDLSTSFTMLDTNTDASLIGTHCQYTYCNQLDFLPFRCESCRQTFCLDHRTEDGHHCGNAGAWAARKRAAALQKTSIGANTAQGRILGSTEIAKPCGSPECKIKVGKGIEQGVLCETCRRTYCLKHRMPEEHNCKNLIPLGARPSKFDTDKAKSNAFAAFGKLKAWGAAKKEEATTRMLPKPKPSSAAARLVATNNLKKIAKGDERLPAEKRVYIYVEAEAETTKSKLPKGAFFYSKDWVIGRVLDAAAKSLMVENVNNQGMEERDKLRVFHVEGGRLLEFGEKVGTALVSGNTIVLLRGVGPAVPDLIQV